MSTATAAVYRSSKKISDFMSRLLVSNDSLQGFSLETFYSLCGKLMNIINKTN